jgi:hypothetical protein
MGKFEKEQFYKPSVYESTKFDSFRVGNLNLMFQKIILLIMILIPAISAGYISQDENRDFPQLIDDKNLKKDLSGKIK